VTVAVAVMAKAPRPGAVKTRLCPPLTHAQAAALARCFLCDRIAQVRRLARASAVVAYAPPRERALFARMAPGLALVPQRGRDLGARMRSVLRALLERGHAASIAVGTDTPTLPGALLQRAVDLAASGTVDVVLGPAEDGGYYLIGVRADHPTLFEDVPWSTPAVLAATLRRARRAGLRSVCLPSWSDVDTPDDLARLRTTLARTPHAAPATRRMLAALG
jgi:rSAM/selenodomain-associated transferase 1